MAYTTIDDPSAHFQAVAYTGGGNSSSVTFGGNSDLQPDFLWIKRRDSADNSKVFDTSRGVGSGNEPYLTTVSDEQEQSYNYLASMDSDGFTHNTTDSSTGASGNTYVAWGWKANGGTRTTNTESGNNPGGGYQANTTSGFSIVDYTGTGAEGTMAHGLGAKPDFIIIKTRATGNWNVYHKSITADKYLLLSTTAAETDTTSRFNDTEPTSTVFTINTSADVNGDGTTYIAYAFRSIQGYSKFGTYTGNGNADGAFIYTGFKPAWVMTKQTNGTNNWHIHDNKRNLFNPVNTQLKADANNADDTPSGGENSRDFLSNGFKFRHADHNNQAHTYIYMAFAEQPFVSSEGVPCTAR